MMTNIKIILVCIACGFLCILCLIIFGVFPVLTNTVDEIPILIGYAQNGHLYTVALEEGKYNITRGEFNYGDRLPDVWVYVDIENKGKLTTDPVDENSAVCRKTILQGEKDLRTYGFFVSIGYSSQEATEYVLDKHLIRWLIEEPNNEN